MTHTPLSYAATNFDQSFKLLSTRFRSCSRQLGQLYWMEAISRGLMPGPEALCNEQRLQTVRTSSKASSSRLVTATSNFTAGRTELAGKPLRNYGRSSGAGSLRCNGPCAQFGSYDVPRSGRYPTRERVRDERSSSETDGVLWAGAAR